MRTKLLRKLRSDFCIFKRKDYFVLEYKEFQRVPGTTHVYARLYEIQFTRFANAVKRSHECIIGNYLYNKFLKKKQKSKIYP